MIFEPNDLDSFRRIALENGTALISTHVHPDADAIGSVLAMREMLSQIGTNSKVVLEEGCPPRYRFLPGGDEIVNLRDVDHGKFSAAIILDSGSLDRIGDVQALLSPNAKIVNIDHHVSNTRFGKLNFVNTTCSATGELLFELASAMNLRMTADLASNLYAGILTDTGRFRYSNTTPRTMQVVGKLMSEGADAFAITDLMYYDIPSNDLLSLGAILATLELFADGLVSTLSVKLERLVGDPDTVVDLALSVHGVEVAAMFSETHEGKIRVSFRSKHVVDVSAIAEKFGGGGHIRAAGCRMLGTLDSVRERILPAIFDALNKQAIQTVAEEC
jgi:phosphoesterase RecJ-like protein